MRANSTRAARDNDDLIRIVELHARKGTQALLNSKELGFESKDYTLAL